MNSFNKKIIIAAAALILIAAGVYFFYAKNKTTKVEANYQKISDQTVLFPTLSADGTKIIYFNNSQKPAFFMMNLDGTDSQQLFELDTPDEVFYSDDKTQAIVQVVYKQYIFEKYGSKFSSPGTTDQSLTTWQLDMKTGNPQKLNDRIASVAWLDKNKIIYELLDQDNNINTLYSAYSNGTNAGKIIDLPELTGFGISKTDDFENLIVYSIPTDVSKTTIYKLNLKNKTLDKITELDDPVKVVALSAEQALAAVRPAANNPELIVIGANYRKDLGVSATTANVARTADNEIFVAARDTKKNSNTFYKITLDTGKKTVISLKPAVDLDVNSLLISLDKKTIFFFDNNAAYSLNL